MTPKPQTYTHAILLLQDRIKEIDADIDLLKTEREQISASLLLLKPAPVEAPKSQLQDLTDYVKKCRGPSGKVRFGAAKPRPVRSPASGPEEKLYVGKDYVLFFDRMGEGSKVILLDGTPAIWMSEAQHQRFVEDRDSRKSVSQTTLFDPPASS